MAADATYLNSDANLVARYELESDGTDSKNGYNLTLLNTPTFEAAKFGNGMVNTSTQNGYVLNNMGIAGGAISMSCWVKINTPPANNTQLYILNHGKASPNYIESFLGYQQIGGVKSVYFARYRQMVAADDFNYPIDLGTGVWHNLIYCYNGTHAYGFVDGVKTSLYARSGNGSSSVTDHFSVGSNYWNGTAYGGIAATIDNVKVFNRALTDEEGYNMYNGLPSTRNPSNLLLIGCS